MRRSAALLPVLLLAAPGAVPAQAIDSVITVTVTRTARVPSHRSVVYVSAEGNAETAREAVARVGEVMRRVVDALRQSEGVELGTPVTTWVGENPALRGYPANQLPASRVARAVVRVSAPNQETLVRAIASAMDAGAKAVSAVAHEATAMDSVRRSMLQEAVAEGTREAEALARAMGGRLGALLATTTSGSLQFHPSAVISYGDPYGTPGPPNEQSVLLNLSLRYRLVR